MGPLTGPERTPIAVEADVTDDRVTELHCQTLRAQDLESAMMSRRWAGREKGGLVRLYSPRFSG